MYTISRDYRKEIVIEKSRFICSLKKVHSEAEAQEFIKAVKKEFWDATHNCSAYIVDDLAQRSSDDGEPSGTAGIPMLEVLRKNGLTETAAVVTRYFGGIKLGAGGLVRAYSHTSKIALQAAHIITMAECDVMSVDVDYSFYERMNNMLSDFSANIRDTMFADNVKLVVSIRKDRVEPWQSKLTDVSNGRYNLKYIESEFAKV